MDPEPGRVAVDAQLRSARALLQRLACDLGDRRARRWISTTAEKSPTGRRHARVDGVKLSDDEVGMFLGGLLAVLVRNRAFELAGDLSDDEWNAQREELTRRAYDDVTAAFLEPLRSKLRADRDNFVANAMKLD